MPISSSEIAQLNGGYLGQHMNQQAFAGMIGQPPGYYSGGGGGDRMMGSAMNRGSAVGGAGMMGAMGMMGLDPMSLGLKAGIGAFSGGAGVGGAMAAGAFAAAPVAIGMAGAAYAGNQMMGGAQGQMQLNNNMRSSFNFQNQHGGQGFTRSDMTQVGGMLRSMTEQFGPGGEVVNFKELSQLTAKMGQMGLAQGVRDVAEFGKKFKEMVTTLKTMAKDLGTTLEGAMEFASAAKGSGIFGMSSAGKFASMARSTAVSGGLALSEVTGAASIGSQISRSMGGLGRQGAMAGMKTIGQIGTAQQMGILSEEDIYNVTGQTGAEGRQSYAASQMQRTASFLQSGRGRRVLASLAGKDGTLNEGAVQQLMGGGMTIGETMKKDVENLAQVGRANFIRNEGRLRGATMERIGAFLPGLQMIEWAKSKGVDINDMDDKSMLFAQRQLHMGRDEVDQAVKMANSLPSIIRQQKVSSENDLMGQEYAQKRKTVGIEGIKTRFEQAREVVNGKLQKVGQDIFNEGSEMIEHFMNKLTGQYVQVMSEDADKAYRSAMLGGQLGQREASRYLGKGPSRLGGTAMGGSSGSSFSAFTAGSSGGVMGLVMGASGRSQYEQAGFGFGSVDKLPEGERDAALGARLQQINEMAAAANAPPSGDLLALGKNNAKWMNDFYATSLSGLKGEERLNAFGEGLRTNGDDQTYSQWQKASPVEKARIMSGLEHASNIDPAARLAATFKPPSMSVFGGTFTTEDKRNAAYSEALVGRSSGVAGAVAGGLGSALGSLFGAGAGAALGGVGSALGDKLFGDKDTRQALGATLASDAYRRQVSDVFSSDPETRQAAVTKVQKDLQGLESQSGAEIEGRRTALQALLASDEFQKSGGTEEDAAKILGKYKSLGAMGVKGAAGMRAVLAGEGSIDATQRGELVLGQAKRRQKVGQQELRGIEGSGLATFEGGAVRLTAATQDKLKGISGGEELLKAAFGASAMEASLNLTDAAAASSGLMGALGQYEDVSNRLAGMSVADKRKVAKTAAGTAIGGMASESASVQENIARGSKKGVLGGAAAGLGVSLSKDEMKEFGGSEATLQTRQNLLLGKMGIGAGEATKEMRGQMTQMFEAIAKGDTGRASKLAMGIQGSEEAQGARKKKSEESAADKDPFGKQTVDLLTNLPGAIRAKLQGIDVNAKTTPAPEAPPVDQTGHT